MDKEFASLHSSVLREVDTTLKSIDLNFNMKRIKSKVKKNYYVNLRNALMLWKETYGTPETDDEVVESVIFLKRLLSELR